MSDDILLRVFFLLLVVIGLTACKKNVPLLQVCPADNLLESFTTPDGTEVYIYENGELFVVKDGSCLFEMQYFDPQILANSYLVTETDTLIISDEEVFPVKNNYSESFEAASTFTDLFISSTTETHLFWTDFTLQSPLAPTIEEYVALKACILAGSCTFRDNTIEIVADPTNSNNTTIKFTSVAPTANMVTAKASITSQLNYFTQNSEVWFQADYYIESGMPFSLVDFESGFFDQSPGPRVIIRDNKLEIENKFGAKINYENLTNTTVPSNTWFTLKVHLKYRSDEVGVVELWQDGEQLISTTGISFPLPNAIINRLEVGISATPVGSIMYVDNIRVSETAF